MSNQNLSTSVCEGCGATLTEQQIFCPECGRMNPNQTVIPNMKPIKKEEPAPEVVEEPVPEIIEKPTPEIVEEPAPEVVEEPAPEVVEEPVPEIAEEPAPEVVEEPVPEIVEEPVPEIVEEPAPEIAEEPAPEVVEEPAPEIAEEPAPEIAEEPAPEIVEEPVPEIVEEPAPAVAEEIATAPAPEFTQDPPFNQPFVPQQRLCVGCNSPLSDDQIFCPMCGSKNDPSMSTATPANNAINNFNAQIENKNKKGKKTLPIIIISIVAVLVAVVMIMYFSAKGSAEKIIDELDRENTNVTSVVNAYESLNPVGKIFFKSSIASAFEREVKNNPYENSDNYVLVNEDMVNTYVEYQKMAHSLAITGDVMEYINSVASLEEYIQYNDMYGAVLNSAGSVTSALDYVENASNTSSYYLMDFYLKYAYLYFDDAIEEAEYYDFTSEMAVRYINSLEICYDEVYSLYNYSSCDTDAYKEACAEITAIVSELNDMRDEIDNTVDNLPTL